MNISKRQLITGEENTAISYLPDRIAAEVRRYAALYGGMINEIRLRSGGALSVTIMGENILCNSVVSDKECFDTFLRLCRNSLYSYTETVKDGFVTTPEGIRVGVCGKAVCETGKILSVSDITSICIRIPRRVIGAGDVAYELLREMEFSKSLIVWSLPSVGKTTLLRELIVRLSCGADPLRVAVIDTRHELCAGVSCNGLVDILDGYPRAKGIEIAKRTMSPQIIVCDEIATIEDADAIMDAVGSGIPFVASVHAGSMPQVKEQENLKRITSSSAPGAYVGLLGQTLGGYRYEIFRCGENINQIIER